MFSVDWILDDDPDAEYNQEYAELTNGRRVYVFSDLDGRDWAFRVAGNKPVFGFDSANEAKVAALREVS